MPRCDHPPLARRHHGGHRNEHGLIGPAPAEGAVAAIRGVGPWCGVMVAGTGPLSRTATRRYER